MPCHDALPQLPLSHGATVARGLRPFEQLLEAVGCGHPRLEAQRPDRPREVPRRPDPATAFTSTRRPAPVLRATHAAIESDVTSHDAGSSSRGRPAGSSTLVRSVAIRSRSVQRSAPGIRSLSSQPNCSMPRIAIRCAVSALRPKRRSASRTASAKRPPPGTTSSDARPAERGADAGQRVVADAAADLDDRQHRLAASAQRRRRPHASCRRPAAPGARRPRVP